MKGRSISAAIVACAVGLGVLAAAPWLSNVSLGQSQTKSINDSAYFFRLTAKYMHGDEPVDFDIVVGCAVRVTVYGDNSSSYDSLFDPRFFVKATKDGGAILLSSPNACEGQTVENGRVPRDFLPATVWFDKAGDFTFGTAYLSEDAYENPNSKLKFLGASIHAATRADWEAFQPTFAKNLLSTKPFMFGTPAPSDAEIAANLWNKEKLAEWLPVFRCYGYQRFHLSDPIASELLRQYWPPDRPRFWAPNRIDTGKIEEKLRLMNNRSGPLVDGAPYAEYITGYAARGWPTRAKGGTFDRGTLSTEIYPMRADDGLPWLKPELATAKDIYRDIDLEIGGNTGFAYCYDWFRYRTGSSLQKQHIPNYFERQFETRINGQIVEIERISSENLVDAPSFFFENDEYFFTYLAVSF